MHKCIGCGSLLQDSNINDIGYTKDLSFDLCERCFRIRNYNEYKFVLKENSDFINIFKDINIIIIIFNNHFIFIIISYSKTSFT